MESIQHHAMWGFIMFATSEENPAAKAVAKVTVVTEYDTPDSQKLR